MGGLNMSDYISREAMSETPKCPYCGEEMVYIKWAYLTPIATFFCKACKSKAPIVIGTDEEIDAKALAAALHRFEPENRVLTLEEATGSDEPVWLEAMSRVFIADVCVSPDARMAQIQTIGKASCAYLPLCDYGVLWRCWLRKPTKEKMEGTPWES